MGLRANAVWAVVTAATLLSGCDLFVDADARVERAEHFIAAQQYREAVIELKNALQSQSENAQARLLLAHVSLHLGDIEAADKELRRAIELNAAPERAANLSAQIHLAQGKYRDLLALLDADAPVLSALTKPQRSLYRGEALLALRNRQAARLAFESVLAEAPPHTRARLGLAEIEAAEGRFDAALDQIDAALREEPGSAEVLLAHGLLHARRGQFVDAESSLQTALESAAKLSVRQQATALAALGDVQLARRDVVAARETIAKLRSIAPDAPLTVMLSARIAMAQQDYTAAIAELQKVVLKAPGFAPARFLLGGALLAQGNLGQAEQQLQQVLQLTPENLEARKLLAQTQLRLQRPDAALQVLLPAVDSDRGDDHLATLLGLAHLQLGDETKGLELLKRSVANNPGHRGLRIELATVLVRSGANAEAIELMRNLEYAEGDVGRERILLAAVLAEHGTAAARAEAESLVASHPKDSSILSLAGTFMATQGDFGRGRTLLSRALEQAPRDSDVLLSRAALEAAANDQAAAAEWLASVLQIDPRNTRARMLMAELALRRNDAAGSIRTLEEARKADKAALPPRLLLARLYLEQRRNSDADAIIAEILAIAEGRANVVDSVGLMELEAGRYLQALAQFREATEIAPDEPRYWLHAARAQLALGDRSAARETLQATVTLSPNWIPAVSALAMLDASDGHTAEALARVNALKNALPRDGSVMIVEGDIHMAGKKYSDAAAAYDQSLRLSPSAAAAMKSYRARQLGELGQPMQPLETWLARQPRDTAARLALAEAYSIAGQRPKAIEQYEVLIRQQALNGAALNNLAWLYHEQGDARAVATARRAYDVAADVPAVADTYGWILVQSGRAPEGLVLLKEAAARAHGHAEIEYHYAVALAATGATVEARRTLTELLSRPGTFTSRADAERLLARLPSS